MVRMYQIIRCPQCATLQYIQSTQKTRTCPKCRKKINCSTLKVLAKAESAREALQIVQTMKLPHKFGDRVEVLKAKLQSSQKSTDEIFGDLISDLLKTFPNHLLKSYLVHQAQALDISNEETEKLLDALHQAGLIIINKDFRPNSTDYILQFPSVPFHFQKMHVQKAKK